MIRKQSILKVVDTSGVRTVLCISTPKGFIATTGDKILVSIQSTVPSSKLNKGELSKAIIVALKKSLQRSDGSYYLFQTNNVVLLNSQELPFAKRILTPVSYILRQKKAFKVLFLASIIL